MIDPNPRLWICLLATILIFNVIVAKYFDFFHFDDISQFSAMDIFIGNYFDQVKTELFE